MSAGIVRLISPTGEHLTVQVPCGRWQLPLLPPRFRVACAPSVASPLGDGCVIVSRTTHVDTCRHLITLVESCGPY